MATEFISNSWLMPTNANAEANRVSNYSLDFDSASSQYLEITKTSAYTVASLSIWVKISGNFGVNERQSLASNSDYNHGRDFMIADTPTTTNEAYIAMVAGAIQYGKTSASGGIPINDGNWHHLVWTYDASAGTSAAINMYVDGQNQYSNATYSSYWAYEVKFQYFGKFIGANAYFDGSMTEVSIFDYALSASQVTELYGTGSAIGNPMSLATKPVNYYPLGNAAFNGEFLASNNATELYENYSLSFDGANDYITFPADASLNISTANHSMSFWLKTTDSGICVVSQKSGTELAAWIQSSKIKWAAESPFSSTSNINDGTWKHICFVADGSSSYIYINGVLDATGGSQIRSSASFSAFAIGSRPGSFPYEGSISNWALFNKALTEDQILTIYNVGVPNDISSLSPVNWWSLSGDSYYNGTDWICPDLGSGGNNGTSVNMAGAELVGNGPGSTANGTATSMNIPANLKGNAPNSSKNAFSVNMTAADRVADVPA